VFVFQKLIGLIIFFEILKYFLNVGAPQEPERKTEKDVDVIDLTLDSDSGTDDADSDEEDGYDNIRGLNTPR